MPRKKAENNSYEDLRRIIEQEDALIDGNFLTLFCKIVFSKKTDKELLKSSTLMAKDMWNFVDNLHNIEDQYKLSFSNLNNYEELILTSIMKSFNQTTRVIDGDIIKDIFDDHIRNNSNRVNADDLDKTINTYIIPQLLTKDTLIELDERFQKRKQIFQTITYHNIFSNFFNNEYKSSDNIEDYGYKLNKLLKDIWKSIGNTTSKTDLMVMSEQTVSDVAKEEKNKFRIPTRYQVLDIPFNGGFENGRLYVFTGSSGSGKSLLLCNLAWTCKCSLDLMNMNSEVKDKQDAILYLSFENSAIETRSRLMCCSMGISREQIRRMVETDPNKIEENNRKGYMDFYIDKVEEKYKKFFNDTTDCDIIIKWAPPATMNSIGVMNLIRDIERDYDKTIRMCIIDYADKMKPIDHGNKTTQEYIDLGRVYDDLKAASIEMNIPFITVSQVNRGGYKDENAAQRSDNLAGSMRKKDNADVLVMFDFGSKNAIELSNNDNLTTKDFIRNDLSSELVSGNYKVVTGFIDKNRDGPSGIKFKAFVDYTTCRFVDSINRIDNIFANKFDFKKVYTPIKIDLNQKREVITEKPELTNLAEDTLEWL